MNNNNTDAAAQKIGTAERISNGAHGTPRYLLTVANETRQIAVVCAGDWAGHVAREAGDHVASEADRLGFPSRFLICVDAKCWKV
jgi:hypothetical protein